MNFIDMPERIERLPRDSRGFPVPKFVWWNERGEPDFRVLKPGWMKQAVTHNLCWLCGAQMGKHKAFVLGPMCAVNRVNSEPPCHYDCARFAALNCPFLTKPKMRRNEKDLPEDAIEAAGIPLARNPGCCCVWITNTYRIEQAGNGHPGILFRVGPASRAEFYAERRRATREEVEHSVDTGLPYLQEMAMKDGVQAQKSLAHMVAAFQALLDESFAMEGGRP